PREGDGSRLRGGHAALSQPARCLRLVAELARPEAKGASQPAARGVSLAPAAPEARREEPAVLRDVAPRPRPEGVRRRGAALALGAVLLLFVVRFHALLSGGVLTFRDSGYFFGPWRALFARQVSAGIPPVWNDASSSGRAEAANPNAGVYWPLTWAVPV